LTLEPTDQPPPPAAPAQIPEPAWWRSPRGAATRTPLTRDAIVEAALRVLDRDGLDGVSMRAVAEELGTGAASLYWHVQNKDALLGLVIDRVVGEIELPPPEPHRWKEQLKEHLRQSLAVLRGHRDIARFTIGRIPIGPNLMRIIEWQLGLMRAAGLPERTCAYAGDLFGLFVGTYGVEESMGMQSPTGEPMPVEQVLDLFRGYLESLPADRFPNINALMNELIGGSPEERFEFGLDVLIQGLAAQTR